MAETAGLWVGAKCWRGSVSGGQDSDAYAWGSADCYCWASVALAPLPPFDLVSGLYSLTYVVSCFVKRHSKWVTGKFVFLNGLWGLKGKARFGRGFF